MIIGVTGTLASGKSLVASKIADIKKATLLNADTIAHSALENDTDTYEKLMSFFGKLMLDEKGKIDKKRLSEIVFSDREKLQTLCGVVHPKVVQAIKRLTNESLSQDKERAVVIDAPLLIEAGMKDFCDRIIVVASDIDNILERAKKHNGLVKEEALKRVRAQMPIKEKEKYADYIIHNNGTLEELDIKINELIEKLK